MAKLRVNLQAGEFEVEGSEAFVERYSARIEALLRRLGRPTTNMDAVEAMAIGPDDEPLPFGSWLQRLPRTATDVDRMLLAGWRLQEATAENWFATADANRLLIEHGIKLGNPSQSVKQNLIAKRAFLVQRGRYRVAQDGVRHLEQLTGMGATDA